MSEHFARFFNGSFMVETLRFKVKHDLTKRPKTASDFKRMCGFISR